MDLLTVSPVLCFPSLLDLRACKETENDIRVTATETSKSTYIEQKLEESSAETAVWPDRERGNNDQDGRRASQRIKNTQAAFMMTNGWFLVNESACGTCFQRNKKAYDGEHYDITQRA